METITTRDGKEVPAIWVDIFKKGDEVHWRGEVLPIDDEFVTEVFRNFSYISDRYGYEIPLQRKHEDDGFTYGVVPRLRMSGEHVQALVGLLEPELVEAYEKGTLRKFSPGFGDIRDPHTGQKLQHCLVEVSFTSREYQWNLRPPQETNQEKMLSFDGPTYTLASDEDTYSITESTMPEELKELLQSLTTSVQALTKRVEALEGSGEDGEGDDEGTVEMMGDHGEKKEMSAGQLVAGISAKENADAANEVIREMKAQRSLIEGLQKQLRTTRTELSAERLEAIGVDTDTSEGKELVKLGAQNPDSFAAMTALLQRARKATEDAEPAPGKEPNAPGNRFRFSDEKGSQGSGAVGDGTKLRRLCAEAVERGAKDGATVLRHLESNGFDITEVDADIVQEELKKAETFA